MVKPKTTAASRAAAAEVHRLRAIARYQEAWEYDEDLMKKFDRVKPWDLSDWETGFRSDLRERVRNVGAALSVKQRAVVLRIVARPVSE